MDGGHFRLSERRQREPNRPSETARSCSSPLARHVHRSPVGVEQSAAARMLSYLILLTLDESKFLGEEKRTRLSLEELEKTELSLRLLRDELPESLHEVYSETGDYLAALDEILSTVLKYRSSGALSKLKEGDFNLIRDSMTVIKNRLDRLGLSEQKSRGVYASTEARCRELSDYAKVGALRGEGNARLARTSGSAENRLSSLYAVCLIFFFIAIVWLGPPAREVVTLPYDMLEYLMVIVVWLLLGLAAIYIIFQGIHRDRLRRQYTEVEEKSKQWIAELKQMQTRAVLPKECFTIAAGTVDAITRNVHAVLDVLDLRNRQHVHGGDPFSLVESQLFVFYDVAETQQSKLKHQLQKLNKVVDY